MAGLGWLDQQIPQEAIDLVFGVVSVGVCVAAFAYAKVKSSSQQKQKKLAKAMNRSLSCPGLVELSREALDACANMMAEFDDRKQYGTPDRMRSRRQPSLPPVVENPSAEGSVSGPPLQEHAQMELSEAALRTSTLLPAVAEEPSLTSAATTQATQATHADAERDGTQTTSSEARIQLLQPNVVVLGKEKVGKSTVIEAIEARASGAGVELSLMEGVASTYSDECYSKVGLALIVWDAGSASVPLTEYKDEHLRTLRHVMPIDSTLNVQTLILCNKTDVTPCPMPEASSLPSDVLFIAGSAKRGTNMDNLWRYVEKYAVPRVSNSGRKSVKA